MGYKTSEFAFTDISIVMAGRIVTGVKEVEYGLTREVSQIFTNGIKAHSKIKKHKEYTGSITLLQSEFEALTDAAKTAGGDDVTDISFDLVVTYAKSITDRIVTDSWIECDITEAKKRYAQGDDGMQITLPMIVSDIKFSVDGTGV